jgi:hypothetical protein
MDKTQAFELHQGCDYLLEDWANVFEGQGAKLVLLQKVIEVLFQHLKDQARVILVLEALVGPYEIVVVRTLRAQPGQDAHFDLPLPGIGWVVLQDLNGHDLIGAPFPTLDHLPKRPSAQEL